MTTKSLADRCRDVLAEIEKIPVIVPGKVSVRREKGGKITGRKLQRWRDGHNETRHIPASMLDRVREGTAGYERFTALADQYAELRSEEVFGKADPAEATKKKPMPPSSPGLTSCTPS